MQTRRVSRPLNRIECRKNLVEFVRRSSLNCGGGASYWLRHSAYQIIIQRILRIYPFQYLVVDEIGIGCGDHRMMVEG